MITVIMVDDDERLADSVCRILARDGGFAILGAFADAEQALAANLWVNADVLICDLGLPGMSGVDLIARVKERAPRVVSLAYTLHEEEETVFAALRAGACGYLLKGSPPAELASSVRSVHAGQSPISPPIARRLLDRFLVSSPQEEKESNPAPLTLREEAILRLLAEGMIYKEVADRMGISPHTVHGHIKNIYEKLHVHHRAEAVRRAIALGYLDGDSPRKYPGGGIAGERRKH